MARQARPRQLTLDDRLTMLAQRGGGNRFGGGSYAQRRFAQDRELATGEYGRRRQAQDEALGYGDFDEALQQIITAPQLDQNAATTFSQQVLDAIRKPTEPEDSGSGLIGSLFRAGELVLDIVDTPRAGITSAVKEFGDLFDPDETASWSEFVRQTNDNIGFGEVIEEWAPGLGEVEMFGVRPLDNMVGFLGEVALDPFTYLTLGSMPLARQGTMGVVRAAAQSGDTALARRVFQRGIRVATDEDLGRLTTHLRSTGALTADEALQGGLHFTLPGTGRISQAISRGRVTPKTIQLLSQDNRALQFLPRTAVNEAAQRFRRGRFARLIGGDRSELKAILRSADSTDEQWRNAFLAIDGDNLARGRDKMFETVLEHRLANVQRRVTEAGFTGVDAYHALGVDEAPAGWDQDLWLELKDLGDAVLEEGNTLARYLGEDAPLMTHRVNWQPAIHTEEWKRYIGSHQGTSSHLDLASFEQRAGIVEGNEFMGYPLLSPADHARMRGSDVVDPEIDSVRQQAQNIVKREAEAWGEDAYDWFETDLWVAMPQQIRNVGRRVRGRFVENYLKAHGVGVDAFVEVTDEVASRQAASYRAAEAIVQSRSRAVATAEVLTREAEIAASQGDARRVAALEAASQALRDQAAALHGVEFPDRLNGAHGLRAAADELNEMAAEVRLQLDQVTDAGRRDIIGLEQVTARTEAMGRAMVEDLARQRRGLSALVRKQQDLYAQAAQAAETFDDELDDAAQRLVTIEKLTNEARELDAMIAQAASDLATASAPRPEIDDAIRSAALNHKRAQKPLRQLNDLIDMLEMQRVADDPTVGGYRGNWKREIEALARELDISPNLGSARQLRDRLQRFSQGQANIVAALKGEREDAFNVARQNLTDLQQWRDEVEEAITHAARINPTLARELALTLDRLQLADTGYLTYGDSDVWFHGIGARHDMLDLGVTPEARERTYTEVDSFLGTHLAQADDYAANYAKSGPQGGQVEAGAADVMFDAPRGTRDAEKLVAVRVRAQKPAVFGPDPQLFGKGKHAPDDTPGYEQIRGQGLAQLHTAMFDHAVINGIIDPFADPTLANRLDVDTARELIDAGTPPSEAFRQAADVLLEDGPAIEDYISELDELGEITEDQAAFLRVAEEKGWTVREDLDAAQSPEEIEAILVQVEEAGHDLGWVPRYTQETSAAEIFNDVIYKWTGQNASGGLVTPQVAEAMAESYKMSLKAQGYDSIAYSLRADSGRWAVIPLDPAQIEIVPTAPAVSDRVRGLDADGVDIAPIDASIEQEFISDALVGSPALMTLRNGLPGYTGNLGELRYRTDMALGKLAQATRGVPGDRVLGAANDALKARGTLAQAVGAWDKLAARAAATDTPASREALDLVIDPVRNHIRQVMRDTTTWSQELQRAAADMRRLRSEAVFGSSRALVRTIEDHIAVMRNQRYGRVQEMFDAADSLTPHIASHQGTVAEGQQALQRNRSRLRDLKAEIRTRENELEDAVGALETEELALRVNADTMLQAAERYEREAAERARQGLADANTNLLHRQRDAATAVAESLRLQGVAEEAQAELVRRRGLQSQAEQIFSRMSMPERTTAVEAVFREGWSRIGANTLLPDEIIEGLENVNRIIGHRSTSQTLSLIDKVTELFKSWAIATPGFHFRNTFGGLFNNALAGVRLDSYNRFHGLFADVRIAMERGLGVDEQVQVMRNTAMAQRLINSGEGRIVDGMEQMLRNGMLSGGQSTELARALRVRETGVRAQHLNPLNPNNAFTNFARRPATRIENYLRGSLALDRLAKGHGIEQAVSDVYKFHFDYDDLSAFERGVLRRVIPFYTWTRKNLPLQLEMMVTNPKVYNRVGSIKREIERESEAEDLVPQWYAERFHIRLPMSLSGSRLYIVPDLPFTELQRAVNPRELVASSNPLIKVPLERLAGKSFFTDIPYSDDYNPLPTPWVAAAAPLLPILEQGGWVARSSEGRWMMTDRNMATLESVWPVLSQARRLNFSDPDDPKVADRWWQNVANWAFGLGIRANTELTQESERLRRQFAERDRARVQASLEE